MKFSSLLAPMTLGAIFWWALIATVLIFVR